MQFFKNLSAVSALFAIAAVAAPVPEPQGRPVVLDQNGQPAVAVTSTQTAANPVQTVTVTHTAGQQPAASTPVAKQQSWGQPAPSSWGQPAPSTGATPTTASQPLQPSQPSVPVQPGNSQTQSQNTQSQSPSHTSSGSSSQPTGSTGATGGQLTIVNKCKNTIYFSNHQNLNDQSGDYQPIAPGKSGHSPISGVSQAVWITNNQANTPYAFGDGTTGQATGNPGAAIVEWNVPNGGGTPFLDLSLIKGNPFVTQGLGGQTLQTPCANPHITSGNQFMTSCNANSWGSCQGTYFDNIPAHDASYGCSNLSQGLVFTACAFD